MSLKLARLTELEEFGEFKTGFYKQLLLDYLEGVSEDIQDHLNFTMTRGSQVDFFTSDYNQVFVATRLPIDTGETMTLTVSTWATLDEEQDLDDDYFVY